MRYRLAILAAGSVLTFLLFWYTAKYIGELIDAITRLHRPSHYNVTKILVR